MGMDTGSIWECHSIDYIIGFLYSSFICYSQYGNGIEQEWLYRFFLSADGPLKLEPMAGDLMPLSAPMAM